MLNGLLSKFENIVIKNDTRISEADREYCEQQETFFNQAKEMINKQIILIMSLINMSVCDDNPYYNINRINFIIPFFKETQTFRICNPIIF